MLADKVALGFFPKDDNLGVLKSTATTCVRMRGWVGVGACVAAEGGRPRRVPAGPDFEKYSRSDPTIRSQILGRGRFLFENASLVDFSKGNEHYGGDREEHGRFP